MGSDLPSELWLEILSYLPDGYIRKLLGVSRVVFELGVDSRYKEFNFVSSDEASVATLRQIQNPAIGQYVQKFYFRPDFLPSVEEYDQLKRRIAAKASRKVLFLPVGAISIYRTTTELQRIGLVLDRAKAAVAGCTNISSVTIVLRDLVATSFSSFQPFISALFSSPASRLQKLSLDVTLEKLWLILDPSLPRAVLKLTDLEITLSCSRFRPSYSAVIQEVLLPFTRSVIPTLEVFSLSLQLLVDINPLFDNLETLPRLKKFNFSLMIPFHDTHTPAQTPSSLASFIIRHQRTLEHLSVRIHHPFSHHLAEESWMQTGASELNFPRLKSFGLGIFTSHFAGDNINNSAAIGPVLTWTKAIVSIPPFHQLENLTILDHILSWNDVHTLVEALSQAQAANGLKKLTLMIVGLHSQLVDLLADKFPHLEALDLSFKHYGLEDNESIVWSTERLYQETFRNQMQARRYPQWNLRYLRISIRPPNFRCAYGHTDLRCMELISRCLPEKPTFGLQSNELCFCIIWLYTK